MAKVIFTKSRIKSWKCIKEILVNIGSNSKNVYFRGQSSSKWPLQSSLSRSIKESFSDQVLPIQLELLEEFLTAYRRIDFKTSLDHLWRQSSDVKTGIIFNESFYELLAFAQHHHLPTMLLDWSYSPYIALFFALSGGSTRILNPKESSAVWAFDSENYFVGLACINEGMQVSEFFSADPKVRKELILHSIKRESVEQNGLKVVQVKSDQNRRMVYQEGLFSIVLNGEDDLEKYLAERFRSIDGDLPILTKLIIPSRLQECGLNDLSLMTINPVCLMNDPTGAASTAFNNVIRFRYGN